MSIELVLIPVAIAVSQAIGSNIQKRMEENKIYAVTTIMKDPQLLQKALLNYGCATSLLEENEMSSEIGDVKVMFQINSQGIFEALFEKGIPEEAALEFLTNIQDEYTSLVQQDIYLKLLERASGQGLVLESEEVNNNNSIVLTFRVN
ncbi:hypothetical protein WQ57_01615 [Mesobacillus campisalis]|uniref:Uncharacterized protein n=1 Tax=Mesobacillus campisalis TaxID=1408103 RepID=A0A0M2T0P3_9BACI|nr:hypothetical protein [Mesobacillus campisalis]KKK39993.1 hypothetical protein WQ57_01615 [Mesobacillus campisalis]